VNEKDAIFLFINFINSIFNNRDLVEMLHERSVKVFLVSGGFRKIINPVADILKIDRQNVYANTILFKENGIFILKIDLNQF
jgi:phosphoserine phosphatase